MPKGYLPSQWLSSLIYKTGIIVVLFYRIVISTICVNICKVCLELYLVHKKH